MGATTFETEAIGDTAGEAFDRAVKSALHWNGHGGYTGTIAEVQAYKMYTIPNDYETGRTIEERAYSYANHLLFRNDDPVSKHKRAGCIQLDDATYLFFGWASS